MTPLVSVVIPSYNHGRFVAAAVHSVLDQSLRELELIVVDDGSEDDSLAILRSFDDPRIRVIPQQNRGAHAAINTGLDLAHGEFLAILNSDDVFHAQRLERLVTELRSTTRLGLAASHVEIIDASGQVTGVKHGYHDLSPYPLQHPERSFRASGDLRRALTTENYLATTSNFVFTRDVWRSLREFRPLRYTHDWDFALRVLRDYDISLVPQPLLQYRVHDNNTIHEGGVLLTFESCWCEVVHLPMIARHEHDSPEYVGRLLHSLHHFGGDGVFVAAMFALLSNHNDEEREAFAVRLLDSNDPLRHEFLSYLTQKRREQSKLPPTGDEKRTHAFTRTVLAKLRRRLRLDTRR